MSDRDPPFPPAVAASLGLGEGRPEIVETHSAWVVFLGDRAYKVKKPVRLGFLDFSTRAAREVALRRELELNRRLAPDVYLGIDDVVGPDGVVCDHVLVMRRLPDDRRLSVLVRSGAATSGDIRAIARAVAAFHGRADTSPEIDAVGHPAAIRGKVERDLEEMRAFVPTVLDAEQLDEVTGLVERYLEGRDALLEARVDAGYVRDGHGDLLADDVFCMSDGPRILDCIEFDDRLRYGDVLADVAFLAMDLEYLGARDLAQQLMIGYREFTDEHHPESLAHYYIAFRALIRSKVACTRFLQGDAPSRDAARSLLVLARDHLRRGLVRLVIVGGAPGTGKSTVAAGLGEQLGWVVLRSDEVRKEITGVSRDARAAAAPGAGIYDAETTRATYTELLARARHALWMGESAILDATWSAERYRQEAAAIARETVSDLVELRCDVAAPIADARIGARAASGTDISDATVEAAPTLRATFAPWPSAASIMTDASPAESVESALVVVAPERQRGP